MHTFYIPPAQWGRRMELSGQEAHHLGRVLRLRQGDEVLMLDGEGREGLCRIVSVAISFRSPDIFTTERSSKAPCCSMGFRRLKMLLIEAYEDYKTLISSKNLLFARLPMWIIYEKQSKIRENELRSKKSLLKAAFKRGEIAQKEYMREVGSIKNSLTAEHISRDRYFMQLYDDIISSCRISPYTIKTAILELMEV